MKFRYLAMISALALIFLLAAVSAQCSDDQRILRLASQTNAHAGLYTGAYPIQICYDDTFGIAYTPANPHSCNNNLILRLAAATNSHAELPDFVNPLGNYLTNVCYGDLQCYSTTNVNCAQPGERVIASLVAQTNAHLANDSSYPFRICCSSQFFINSPVCGNGVRQGTEQCDDGNLNNNDACKNDCTNNVCGDGVIYTGVEQCDDGNTINGDGCSSTCQNELLNCGNGNIDPGEQCDDGNLNSQSCATLGLGYTGGILGCSGICQFDTSQCTATNGSLTISNVVTNPLFPISNNGNPQQVTVSLTATNTNGNPYPLTIAFNLYNSLGNLVNTQGPITIPTSSSLPAVYTIPGSLPNGVYTLRMTIVDSFGNTVTITLGTITVTNITPQNCGNGQINAGEQCDGTNLNNLTCQNLNGYTGGTLSCDSSCQFDTSQCTGGTPGICGDNVVNPGETCDGTNFTGLSCSSFGFTGGSLSCNLCQILTSSCTGGQESGGDGKKKSKGILSLFAPEEETATPLTGFIPEEEIEVGKKLEAGEESFLKRFFSSIASDVWKSILFILLLLVILMLLLIAILAGRRKKKNALPEQPQAAPKEKVENKK